MQFDVVKSMFIHIDKLINKRSRKINEFMDVLRDLEKEKTKLTEDCYKRYMIDIKQLPGDALQRLYNKYIKVN